MPPAPNLGDANGDGVVNILDIIVMVNYIMGTDDLIEQNADFNQDNTINILDIVAIVNYILSGGA